MYVETIYKCEQNDIFEYVESIDIVIYLPRYGRIFKKRKNDLNIYYGCNKIKESVYNE